MKHGARKIDWSVQTPVKPAPKNTRKLARPVQAWESSPGQPGDAEFPRLHPEVEENFKSCLLEELTREYPEIQPGLLYKAVMEALALASLKGLPHLLLPVLAWEKAGALARWHAHQIEIFRNGSIAFAA